MLYIFDNTETLIDKLPEGSFFDTIHREVLNGENTFEFSIPTGSEFVIEGNLVAFRDLDSYWQVFEIKRLVDQHGDGLTRTAYCEHIFYELLDDIVTDKRPQADATAALTGMLENTRWQAGIVDDLGASSTSVYYESALSGVQKVAEAWQGELKWRCVISGGVITRYVDLLAMRGTDTGKQFAYSKDILSIEREEDISNIATALYGRGKGVETESGEGYGRRLTFAEIEAADKPLGQEWIGDNAALAQWGRNGRHRFDVFTDEDETDPAALLEKTRAELAKLKVPRVTYRLDVVSLEELTDYEHEKVRLGDLVRVIDREFKPELVVSARVIDIERDIIDPANTKVVLGSFAPTIIEATINTAQRVDAMANRPFNTKWLDGQISVLQNAINSAMSNWWTDENGNLIFEAKDGLSAMKLAGEGFAIANSKTEDVWNWRTFGTGAGFAADLMTTGILDAALVQIGAQTTFEAGYDPSKNSAVGMGVDDNCTGLWHLDGSLNSHKGLAAEFDGDFVLSKWGQGVKVDAGKTLKIPTADILHPEESSVNMLAYNLASSPNGSVIFDLGDSDGNQAIKVGIAPDGKLFIEDNKVEYAKSETSQADFNTGTLTSVVSNPTGDLTLAAEGTNFADTINTQIGFAAFASLTNVEATSDDKLKLKYIPGQSGYGSNLALGKSTIASTNPSESPKVVDGGETTYWSATASAPQWIDIDLGENKSIAKLRIRTLKGRTFMAKASLDALNWDDLGGGSLTDYEFSDFLFAAPEAYRFYRSEILTSATVGANSYPRVYEIELMELFNTPGTYALSGTWTKEYNLSAVGVSRSSTINWNETIPANTSIQVQAAIALDGVNYGSYANCASGSAIPGITAGVDLSSAKVKFKVTLATTNNTVTPSLNSLTLNVYSAYKTSGNRVHIYDISGVGIAELSSISWNATLPTGTSVAVKAAISTNGGSTYGALQSCTSGQAIPVLTNNMDVSNARLKIQEDLATTNYSATPKLNSLNFSVSKVANVAYGVDKSTLIGWDNIVIEWRLDRLSLVVNGEEVAFIENPGQVSALATYAYIGSDKAGANQIETIVDELRVDKVYQEIAKVNAWHIVDAPFYTSEEFKQWPGYVRTETDGLKIYDSEGNLRVVLGSWLVNLLRKYGLKIIDGEIYSSIIRSGAEDATAYIQFAPPNRLEVFGNSSAGTNLKMLEIGAPDDISEGKGGQMDFYLNGNFMGVVAQQTDAFWILNAADIKMSSLNVVGSKNCIEDTPYGQLAISARESPEVRYIDEEMGTLVNGVCRVDVDPIFMECIEPHTEHSKWYIDLTPYGKAILYVDEIGDNYFIVRDYNDNANGVKFKWSLSATRKNYAHIRFREVV